MHRLAIATALLLCAGCAPAAAAAAELGNRANIEAILADNDGSDGRFSFIVIGDSRYGDSIYARLLEQAMDYDPLFVLNTGDFVMHGHAAEYEKYKEQIRELPVPIVHIPGNHEIIAGRDGYEKFVGDWNWSFDYYGWRFIGLDNSGRTFGQHDIDFAAEHLSPTVPGFTAFHCPPAVARWRVHSMASDEEGGRGGEMLQLIARSATKLVFLGHIHLYDVMEIGGIPYIISAGGGAGLYGQHGFGRVEHGFVVVSVDGRKGRYDWVPLSWD